MEWNVTELENLLSVSLFFFELNADPNNFAYAISPMIQNQYKHENM